MPTLPFFCTCHSASTVTFWSCGYTQKTTTRTTPCMAAEARGNKSADGFYQLCSGAKVQTTCERRYCSLPKVDTRRPFETHDIWGIENNTCPGCLTKYAQKYIDREAESGFTHSRQLQFPQSAGPRGIMGTPSPTNSSFGTPEFSITPESQRNLIPFGPNVYGPNVYKQNLLRKGGSPYWMRHKIAWREKEGEERVLSPQSQVLLGLIVDRSSQGTVHGSSVWISAGSRTFSYNCITPFFSMPLLHCSSF